MLRVINPFKAKCLYLRQQRVWLLLAVNNLWSISRAKRRVKYIYLCGDSRTYWVSGSHWVNRKWNLRFLRRDQTTLPWRCGWKLELTLTPVQKELNCILVTNSLGFFSFSKLMSPWHFLFSNFLCHFSFSLCIFDAILSSLFVCWHMLSWCFFSYWNKNRSKTLLE